MPAHTNRPAAAAPAAAAAMPARTVNRATGTVHAVSPSDPMRTACGRPRYADIPAHAVDRAAVCVSTCTRCDRMVPNMPAAWAAPVSPAPCVCTDRDGFGHTCAGHVNGTPVGDAPVIGTDADGADVHADMSDPAHRAVARFHAAAGTRVDTVSAHAPARDVRTFPIHHDGAGDTMVTWDGCIVGARFTHHADALRFAARLRVTTAGVCRPVSCPLPSGGYGACVRQRDHGGRCADASGARYTFPARGPAYPRPGRPAHVVDTFGARTVVTWAPSTDGERPLPLPSHVVDAEPERAPAVSLPALASRADIARAVDGTRPRVGALPPVPPFTGTRHAYIGDGWDHAPAWAVIRSPLGMPAAYRADRGATRRSAYRPPVTPDAL